MSDFELRPFAEPVEIRSVDGKLVLSGTAIRYGARSKDLGGFRERVMPGAATEAIQKGDVLALDEHRHDRYLGRSSNGTLRLIDTPTELRYEVDLPDTSVGREVAALAERKDYKGSSFGFRARPENVKWTKDDDGTPLRSIHGFSFVRDVGPTISPAYEATTAEMVLRCFPAEAERDVEVRSVLEAAARGELAALLDGETLDLSDEQTPDVPVIHRRPSHWFV
jgi:HK97 family phage prohead protease